MEKDKSICVFGDSTSWGAWDEEKGGWVNRLWLFLADHEPYSPIFNLGIDGGTSKTILERFEKEAHVRNAGVLIFQTGGNDASTASLNGLCNISLDDFKKNILEIIEKAKLVTDKIVFLDLKNCDETKTLPVSWGEYYYNNENILKYSKAMEDICKEKGVLFLDIEKLENDEFEDGLHPNAKGHQKIFLQVKDFLLNKKLI